MINVFSQFQDMFFSGVVKATGEVFLLVILIALLSFVGKRASAQFRYWLWCVVLVRLCIPVGLTSPMGIGELLKPRLVPAPYSVTFTTGGIGMSMTDTSIATPAIAASAAPSAVREAGRISWRSIVMNVWAFTVAAGLLLATVRSFAAKRKLRDLPLVSRPDLAETLQRLRQLHGIAQQVTLRVGDGLLGSAAPFLAGTFHPTIILPTRMVQEWSISEIEPVLLHELEHIRRKDLLVNWFQIITQIIYFFHPLVWYANWRIRQEREWACDDMAVERIGGKPGVYGRSILKVIEESRQSFAWASAGIGMAEPRTSLGRRIVRIMSTTYRSPKQAGRLATFSAVALGIACIAIAGDNIPGTGTLPGFAPQTSIIAPDGKIVDKVDLPFVDDTSAIGKWVSVDFVRTPEEFRPEKKSFQGELILGSITFEPQGTCAEPWWTWTKGFVMHHRDKTASAYTIREVGQSPFMFLEWKSGDYTIRHQKPAYYVLRKAAPGEVAKLPSHAPKESTVNAEGRIEDRIDLPFQEDPALIGRWKSVDFVPTPEEFKPGKQAFKEELFLKGFTALPEGKCVQPWWQWTKGFIIHRNDKTASQYAIKELAGSTYLFLEWKSGDYTIRHMKPAYYVLQKTESREQDPVPAFALPGSTMDNEGRLTDRIDLPFVDDPDAVAGWKSVDIVDAAADFVPGKKQFPDKLVIDRIEFSPGGKTTMPWFTWTKGFLMHSGDKTASRYEIKPVADSVYMFLEIKGGDYIVGHRKPMLLVMKKEISA